MSGQEPPTVDPVQFALVEGARAGDREAREILARRALTLALRTALGVLGNRHEAADVAQDVAVDVLRGIAGLRDPASFDAWVHRITVRRSIRALRARRLMLRKERSIDDLTPGQEPSAPSGAGASVLSPALRQALLTLPARQRLAVVLRYLQDLSEEQVAAALGCSPGTAASLLSRARASLRQVPELRELGSDPVVGEGS